MGLRYGRALVLDERLRAWLAGRDWKRGHWPPTGSCYRFADETDADAFAAEFGGRRSF